jgi:hypothetical protein
MERRNGRHGGGTFTMVRASKSVSVPVQCHSRVGVCFDPSLPIGLRKVFQQFRGVKTLERQERDESRLCQ